MKKGLGLILMGVYIISTVLFCGGTLKEKAGMGAWTFKDMTVSATDFGVMCISAAYPNINMKLADSRDNEGQQDGNDAKGGLAGTVVSAVSADDEKKPEALPRKASGHSSISSYRLLQQHPEAPYPQGTQGKRHHP